MKKYDFVIPLKADESIWADNNELKYLLRSVEQNFPVRNVILIGTKMPEWLNTNRVIILEIPDEFRHNKDANIINKVLQAARLPNITPTFFWSCDDHLVLRKPKADELKPYFLSDLKNEQAWFWSGVWKKGLKQTMEFLDHHKKTTIHYDVHIPQPINAEKFKSIFEGFAFEEHVRFTINTLYFNQAGLKKHYHIGILKATFERPVSNMSEIETSCYNRLYINYNDQGLTSHLQKYIVNKFPNKSKYEL